MNSEIVEKTLEDVCGAGGVSCALSSSSSSDGKIELCNLKISNWGEWLNQQKKRQIPTEIQPTAYNISTITTNCRFFYESEDNDICPIFINYLSFFNLIKLSESGIRFKKYRFRAQSFDWPDVKEYERPPQKMVRKNSKMKGVFYNQVTLEIYSELSEKKITTFLYDNGSCNNTGNKSVDDTFLVCEKLCEYLTDIHTNKTNIIYHYRNVNLSNWDETQTGDLEAYLNENLIAIDLCKGKLICKNMNVSTMNAKYNAGIKLNRDNLLRLIKKNNEQSREQNSSSNIYLALLETSNYAGLNIKIRWDKNCHQEVHQKSKKKWKCACSDITILAFQSGEIMISGAKSIEQLNFVKNIFDKLIRENVEEVIDIDLQNIINIPNQKRIKRIHKYFATKEVGDKTFIVVSNESC
jgi:TATA-box binding protein (TBP) (component of TFIID and TFIIIB)